MCGIIGYTGGKDAVEIILDGLKRLEYRGYDSAGIAASVGGGKLSITRCKGKIADLAALLQGSAAIKSHTAIGHTRWATHGRPSVENAHPHHSGKVVIVHNGIVENYAELKKQLQAEGRRFESETDTEVLSQLIDKHYAGNLEDALRKALRLARGAYAIAAMSEDEPGKIVAFRKDSPLVAGISEGNYFVASDIPAFLNHSRDVVFLEDGQMAVLTPKGIEFFDVEGARIKKEVTSIGWNISMAEKGGFKHFMLKEIFEQPRSIGDTVTGRMELLSGSVVLEEFGLKEAALKSTDRIVIVACGTSWHSALVGKYMIEELAGITVEVDIASEFRYRNPILTRNDLFISITQSGETADTLAAQRLAKSAGLMTLNICNVVGSTSAREADAVFYTRSGPEIGVASTKAFTAQLIALYMLAIAIGSVKGKIDSAARKALLAELMSLPDKIETCLKHNAESIEHVAKSYHHNKAFLFLGRGLNFPIALEGALKLKEISYTNAEGYPAGEMKHGPIALVDDGYPVLVLAPRDEMFEKVASNIQEIRSRGGSIIMVTDDAASSEGLADHTIAVPTIHKLLMPVLMVLPLQLFSYHIGVLRGCDVDQPRNLAKSVTVE